MQRRLIHDLMHVDIAQAGHAPHLRLDLLGDLIVLVGRADYLNVDRRRYAEVEYLIHHIAGLKINAHIGKFFWDFSADAAHIVDGFDLMFGLQRHEYFSVGGGDGHVVTVGQVGGWWNADIIDDHVQIFACDDAANLVFHRAKDRAGFLDARADGRVDVHANLAGIDHWEKIAADKRHHDQRACEQQGKHQQHAGALVERPLQCTCVGRAEALEAAIKGRVDMSALLQDVTRHHRHQGARQRVGCHHREHYRQRHGRKQIFCGCRQSGYRQEHDADAQHGHERGRDDLSGTVQYGLLQTLAHVEMAVNIFYGHRGVVHQDAHRQRKPAQGHEVERMAQRRQQRDGK